MHLDRDAHSIGKRALSADDRLDTLLATGPFHAALRVAIRERGLSLERLRSHLAERGIRIAVSSLSFWQHGHTVPTRQDSVRAVGALEQILQLPPTSLLKLLANAQAGDGLEATRRGGGSDDRGGALGELLDSVPGSRRHDVEVVSRHEKVVVDADGCLATLWVRTVVRARTDGVDRYIVRCFAEEDGSVDEVRVYPLANCRLGQVHRHATAPIFLAEVLFDEALRAGDSWVFEFEVANGGGSRLYEFAHNFTHPVDHYLVEVRFDPAALPVDCYAYVRPGLYDEYRRIETLTLNRHHAVHHMASNLTAGVLGIAWTWPDAADHRQSTG